MMEDSDNPADGTPEAEAPHPPTKRDSDQVLISSLLTAIVRADGDALVMHVGERPYVVALSGVVELSTTPVTFDAMMRMLDRLLPAGDRAALEASGAVQHELTSAPADGERYRLVAAWGGDDIWIEIRRYRKDVADAFATAFGAEGPERAPESEPAASSDGHAGVVVPFQRVETTAGVESADPSGAGLDELIQLAATRRASTLYLFARSRPMVRVEGELVPLETAPSLEVFEVEALLQELASDASTTAVSRPSAAPEWSRQVADVGRVRCVAFRDHRGPGLVCHINAGTAASVEELGLSLEIQRLVMGPDGLILVTGGRQSGKSTVCSALIDLINTTRSVHVIVLDRQIRHAHDNQQSFISQREVRGDGADMAAAARAALREDPDVLVIGDIRSRETIAVALEAAESGRLVIGTFPATGTVAALERMLGHLPIDRRLEYRRMLSSTFRGAIAQVLLQKTGGRRLAARELLLNTPRVAELIADGKIFELPGALESGRSVGMVPMNDALAAFVRRGAADAREAYRVATDRDGLLQALRRAGLDTSFVERRA